MKKTLKCAIIFLFLIIFICFCVFLYALFCINQIDKKLLNNSNLLSSFENKLNFYDINGKNLDSTFENGKSVITLSELPDYVKNAFIAIEDKNFYSHNGVNLKRIIKAGLKNIISGSTKEGASTISQQLIKNIHLTSDKTLKRKIQEAYLTLKLEKQHSKDEILSTYLNVIYFGNGNFGIENAAKNYFNCSAKNLTIAQAATLAGIIKSPSYYSPLTHPNKCVERRNLVLKEMLRSNFITKTEYEQEKQKDLGVMLENNLFKNSIIYGTIIGEARKILNLSEKDAALSQYNIFTYIDKEEQKNLENNLKDYLNNIEKDKQINSIITILDNKTKGIIALATTISDLGFKRQPASLIKPFLCYAPAFEKGILSPLTPIDDSKTSFENWEPKNVDNRFDGFISTREAIFKSKNIPAIKALEYVGLKDAKNYAQNMGVEFDLQDNHLALALGAMKFGINPLHMASIYSTFASDGEYAPCCFIKKIEDKNGNIIYEHTPQTIKVFSEETCYLMSDCLSDCVKKGTAKKLEDIPLKLSAKTGTVGKGEQNTDAWCVSFNKNYTIVSWTGNISGNNANNLNKNQNGGSVGSTLNKFAWQILLTKQNEWLNQPKNIENVKIDAINLKENHILSLADKDTPERFIETDIFNKQFLPTSSNIDLKLHLDIKIKDNEIVLSWNENPLYSYDIYENNELYDKDCKSSYTLKNNNYTTTYYVIAKNKYNNKTFKSNIQTVYANQNEKQNILKQALHHWFT